MNHGEDTCSVNKGCASVGSTIPSRKLPGWRHCLSMTGEQMLSSVCTSNWSSCVPDIRLEFATPRPTRKSEALLLVAQPGRWLVEA